MPYIGYISLIKHTDLFILFDTVQYIKHGWIERNRILKPNGGWQYIKVSLKKQSRDTLIKNAFINNDINWQGKIIAQLQHYKKKAPYYNQTINLFEEVFCNKKEDITSLNYVCLLKVLEYLGIDKEIKIFSKMNLPIEQANAPDEWALNICKALGGVKEYWNPPGGKSFFNSQKYLDSNIKLKFHEITLTEYNQKRGSFETGLSIIDVLMFNSAGDINQMLDNYKLT